jgi:hypothetical protein
MCFCFLGLMVGSLWLFASSATIPSIPPWREQDQNHLFVEQSAPHQQTAAVDFASTHVDRDLDLDVDDTTASSAALVDDDEQASYVRRT